MGFRVGIDIGGTFTDAISVDDNGVTQTAKSSTTPGNLIVVRQRFWMVLPIVTA